MVFSFSLGIVYDFALVDIWVGYMLRFWVVFVV